MLLLYSDGLIERRHHDLHDSMDHLARHVAELPTAHDLADAATNLIRQLQAPDRTIDDIATLLVRRPRADHLAGDVSTAQS